MGESVSERFESVVGDREWRCPAAWAGQGGCVLVAVLSGRCEIHGRSGVRLVSPCHVAALPVGEESRLVFRRGQAVLFTMPEVARLGLSDATPATLDPVSATVLEAVFFEQAPGRALQIAALQFVCLQVPSLRDGASSSAATSASVSADALWEVADRYLQEHLDEPLTLARLVEVLGCSRGALSGQCRAQTGLTPMRYLGSLRLQRSQALLEQGTLPIGEIAGMVGYADVAAFSHFFKRHTGLSPSQARDDARWLA